MTSTQITDNIAEYDGPTPGPKSTNGPEPSVAKCAEFFSIYDAEAAISKQFDRVFKKLLFVAPPQVNDGCVAEFYDDEMKIVVATCRMRFRNQFNVDIKTGAITISADLSDLSFKPLVMSISSALATRSAKNL